MKNIQKALGEPKKKKRNSQKLLAGPPFPKTSPVFVFFVPSFLFQNLSVF